MTETWEREARSFTKAAAEIVRIYGMLNEASDRFLAELKTARAGPQSANLIPWIEILQRVMRAHAAVDRASKNLAPTLDKLDKSLRKTVDQIAASPPQHGYWRSDLTIKPINDAMTRALDQSETQLDFAIQEYDKLMQEVARLPINSLRDDATIALRACEEIPALLSQLSASLAALKPET